MAGNKKGTAAVAEEAKPAQSQKADQHSKSTAEFVSKVIASFEGKLDQLKPTVGDLVRLWQIEKEMAEEHPREITVSWIEPHEKEKEDAPGK
jgi:thiamine biosynthesis lipoprotein ApbE